GVRETGRGLLFPARAQPHPLLGSAGLKSHSLLYAARRPGGRDRRRDSVPERFRRLRRSAHDGERRLQTYWLEPFERPGALCIESAVESEDGKGVAGHVAQRRRGETGGRAVERKHGVFWQS